MSTRRRTAWTKVLAGLAVLGTAGGGVAYTAVIAVGADRTAPTTVWEKREKTPSHGDPAPNLAEGRRDDALSRKLLPVPDGYRLGPDIDEFGNDARLSGKQAQALLEESGADLPSKQRKEHRKFVQKLDVQGLAMRSYALSSNDLVVEIQLAQMKNKKAVHDLSTFQSKLADALSIFRAGPEIEGHKHAKCHLLPKDSETELDAMFCTAYQEDMLVSVTATGSKPFPEKKAAKLLEKQLDRLVDGGGEYV